MQVTCEEAARLAAEAKQRIAKESDRTVPTAPGLPVDEKFMRGQSDAAWLRLGGRALWRIFEAAVKRPR